MTLQTRSSSLLCAAAVASLLAGCNSWRASSVDATAAIPIDYRERHPIVLRDAPKTLDVFVGTNAGSLDVRQRADVVAFGRDFLAKGSGAMAAYVPYSSHHAGISAIRGALAEAGLSGVQVAVTPYQPDDPTAATPIRLSFARLQAQVDSRCDVWTQDLASGGGIEGWQNRNYPNFGCSYQKNLAAQVANPLDLVRPREEDPLDATKRINGINRLRQGVDPSTSYRTGSTQVNQGVSSPTSN